MSSTVDDQSVKLRVMIGSDCFEVDISECTATSEIVSKIQSAIDIRAHLPPANVAENIRIAAKHPGS